MLPRCNDPSSNNFLVSPLMSMSAVFDDPSCQLSDGWIGARGRPWAPTAHDAAVVLAAVKDAARRRRRWPEAGPSFTATARAGWGCAGRDGRMVRGRTEGCGETSHFRFPRAVENSGSGSPACVSPSPSVSEVGVLSIAKIRILLRSTLPSPIILRAQIQSDGRQDLHCRGRY